MAQISPNIIATGPVCVALPVRVAGWKLTQVSAAAGRIRNVAAPPTRATTAGEGAAQSWPGTDQHDERRHPTAAGGVLHHLYYVPASNIAQSVIK